MQSGGVDFPALVHSSFPHLLPDLTRDSISGSSLFLAALRSSDSSLPFHLSPSTSAHASFSSASSSTAPPLFAPSSQTSVPPSPASPSAPHLLVGPVGAGPFPSSTPPRFPSQAHTPAMGFAPPPLPSVSAPAPPPPFWTSFSAASSSQTSASSIQGPTGVHVLGMGYPLSTGVPPVPPYPSAHSASSAPPPPYAWPPAGAPSYDPHDFSSYAHSDSFADPDDRLPDDVHPPTDPSAPSISLDSSRSEYRRMIDYVCSLFPQVVGVPPVDPPPRALFKSFFAEAPQAQTPLSMPIPSWPHG